jgi:hypothetical protein
MTACRDCERAARWESTDRDERFRKIAELQRREEAVRAEIRQIEAGIDRAEVEVAQHRATHAEA